MDNTGSTEPQAVREVEHYDVDTWWVDEPQEGRDMRIQHAAWERMGLRRYTDDPEVSDVDLAVGYSDLSYKLVRRLARTLIDLEKKKAATE